MNFQEAILVAVEIIGKIWMLAVIGLVGLAAVAWAWYRMDGGKMSLLEWLRGI